LVTVNRTEMQETRQHIGEWTVSAQKFGSEGKATTDMMESLYKTTSSLEITIAQSALHAFVETAKVEHLAYKYEAVEALLSGSNKLSAAATDDTACQLGHWVRTGDGKACFSRLGAFRQLEKAHGEFHQCMTAMSSMADAPPANIMRGVSAIDVAERDLMHALDQLMTEAEKNTDVFCTA